MYHNFISPTSLIQTIPYFECPRLETLYCFPQLPSISYSACNCYGNSRIEMLMASLSPHNLTIQFVAHAQFGPQFNSGELVQGTNSSKLFV